MGLVLLGADNLASDQADQKPNTYKRGKEPATNPWPEPTGWIEYRYDSGENPVKMIYHNYITMPTVTIPATVTEIDLRQTKLTEIPDSWLRGNTSVQVVRCPNSLKKINYEAFRNCTNLKSCYMPEGLELIGDKAFSGCSALELDSLPTGLKTVVYRAFSGCISIEVSDIPDSVEVLGYKGMSGDTYIGLVFENCTGIRSMHVGQDTEVKARSFSGCSNMEHAEYGAQIMDEGTFRDCASLAAIWVRESCTTIEGSSSLVGTRSPFNGCPDDLVIYAEADAKPDGWNEYFNRVGDGTVEATVVYGQKTSPF